MECWVVRRVPVSKPRDLIFCENSAWPVAKFGSEISPEPWARKPSFLEAVILGSSCLRAPVQAFRGFLKSSSPASSRSWLMRLNSVSGM